MIHQQRNQPIRTWAIALISMLLVSCGSNKTKQCREILQTIQQSEAQRVLGDYTREAQRADIERYQTLADELAAINIKNSALQDHQTQLIDAYRSLAVSVTRRLDASNEAGHLSYREGDTDAEAAVNTIQAQEMQAYNKIDLAAGLFYNTCSN